MNKLTIASLAALPLILAGCELAPKTAEQTGYRGTGMAEINVTPAALREDVPAPPYELRISPDSPTAGEVYENVQVLGDISRDEFDYLMAAITEWVSPEQGCNYCHNPADLASDEVYTKQVSRQMIQMTRGINQDWSNHVQQTGVTCWTCHRGNNIPNAVWSNPGESDTTTIVGNRRNQNQPDANVGYASLPTQGFSQYLGGDAEDVRVASNTAFPNPANQATTMDAEESYGIMMHLSQSLGVNCVHCHNSQSFREWAISRGQRETAWYGIRMVRQINGNFIDPLAPILPPNRLGPEGDPLKVNCVTCHQGQRFPLGRAQMVADYPALRFAGGASPNVEATPAEADGEMVEEAEELASAE